MATTHYVTSAASGGDGSEGSPYTLVEAADNVAAGDKVWVKADAEYAVQDGANGCVVFCTTAGTTGAPITWEGYTTTTGDGGRVTLNAGTNTLANGIGGNLTSWYYQFKNFRCTGGSGPGASINGTTGDYVRFWNCRLDSNTWGVQGDNGIVLIGCEVDTNSSGGVDFDFHGGVYFCEIHGNSGNAINSGNGNYAAIGNVLYNNGANSNIRSMGGSELTAFIGNTIDGDDTASSVGINQDNAAMFNWVALNNLIMDCATGIKDDRASGQELVGVDWNKMISCATARTGYAAGDNEDTAGSDPFTASGTRDYTLTSGGDGKAAGVDASWLINADGPAYMDLGGQQREEPAGGAASGARNPFVGPIG